MEWAAVFGALAAVIPVLVKIWSHRYDTNQKQQKSLQQRSLDELHAGTDGRVRARASVPPQ